MQKAYVGRKWRLVSKEYLKNIWCWGQWNVLVLFCPLLWYSDGDTMNLKTHKYSLNWTGLWPKLSHRHRVLNYYWTCWCLYLDFLFAPLNPYITLVKEWIIWNGFPLKLWKIQLNMAQISSQQSQGEFTPNILFSCVKGTYRKKYLHSCLMHLQLCFHNNAPVKWVSLQCSWLHKKETRCLAFIL